MFKYFSIDYALKTRFHVYKPDIKAEFIVFLLEGTFVPTDKGWIKEGRTRLLLNEGRRYYGLSPLEWGWDCSNESERLKGKQTGTLRGLPSRPVEFKYRDLVVAPYGTPDWVLEILSVLNTSYKVLPC